MSKQTFTTGQVLTAAQVNSLQANDYNQTVSAKTASYVLVAADKGTRIEFNTSGSVTCTVNTGLFDAGDTLVIQNRGAGTATVTAGTATVNTSGSLVVNQYESGTLYFISASAALWFGSNPGDITAVTAGTGISGGGTSGAITITNSMATEITAAGDIIIGTGSGTFDNLPIGTTGQILTADTTVSPYKVKWAAASSGALTKITSSSFSAAASVSVNDCFSATYDHYRIIVEASASAAQDIAQRWRVSGADNTSAIYDYGYVYVTGTAGPTRASANNATSNTWAYNGTGEPSYISVDVYYPFLSTRQTGFTGLSVSYEADSSANYIGGNHNSNSSFTGFTLFPKTSGTITGKVTVYGYQI